jgi:hypothetical protein
VLLGAGRGEGARDGEVHGLLPRRQLADGTVFSSPSAGSK